jgi:hypothetical protein
MGDGRKVNWTLVKFNASNTPVKRYNGRLNVYALSINYFKIMFAARPKGF